MLRYLGKRLLLFVPVLLVVGITVFMVIRLIPGDPAQTFLGEDATPAEVRALRIALGLNRPLIIQFWLWVSSMVHGQLGNSLFFWQPVGTVIEQHLAPTVSIMICAIVIEIMLALITGTISALHRGSWIDSLGTTVAFAGIAMPDFWSGLLLALVFAVWLRWLPVSGYDSLSRGVGSWLSSIVLPSLALGFAQAGLLARMLREALIGALREDYIQTARAKGLLSRTVVFRHAFPNAIIPALTVLGASVAALLSGAVIIETVFNIHGIGWLTVNAVLQRDYPLVQGVVLFFAVLYSAVNLVVDMSYAIIDPRIRYE